MERAAGEGVQIHHVNERGGAVDERSVVRREGELIAEAVGIARVEAAGRAVYGVLGIPSGSRELFFIAVCIPDRVEDRQRVVDSRGGLVLCRGLGLGRLGRRLCARSLRRLFSRLGLGLLLGLLFRLLGRLLLRRLRLLGLAVRRLRLLRLAVRRLLLCWLRLLGLLRLVGRPGRSAGLRVAALLLRRRVVIVGRRGVLAAAGGERQQHREDENEGKRSFHANGSP